MSGKKAPKKAQAAQPDPIIWHLAPTGSGDVPGATAQDVGEPKSLDAQEIQADRAAGRGHRRHRASGGCGLQGRGGQPSGQVNPLPEADLPERQAIRVGEVES